MSSQLLCSRFCGFQKVLLFRKKMQLPGTLSKDKKFLCRGWTPKVLRRPANLMFASFLGDDRKTSFCDISPKIRNWRLREILIIRLNSINLPELVSITRQQGTTVGFSKRRPHLGGVEMNISVVIFLKSVDHYPLKFSARNLFGQRFVLKMEILRVGVRFSKYRPKYFRASRE